MVEDLSLRLLGKPEILWRGEPLTPELISLKGQALLIYLAVTGEPSSRSSLAALLWGDMPEERAKANLRLALTKVRQFIAPYFIVDRQDIAFDLRQPHWLDTAQFQASLAPVSVALDSLREATTLYRGDFLNDFYVPEAPTFEEWARMEAERLRQMAFHALSRLAEEARTRGDFHEGIQSIRRLLHIEPWHEEAHQQLMWLLAYSGQRSAALAQYETCRRVLAEELAVEPSEATTKLYEQIRREAPEVMPPIQVGAPLFTTTPAQPAPAETIEGPRLPVSHSPFVGRKAELEKIDHLLGNPTCRVLTLVGPGGIGKTRLAITAAASQQNKFRHGVTFVALAGVKTAHDGEMAELLVNSMADAIGYQFSAQRPPRELLVQHLRDKEMLLLLDNFEQLQPVADFLTEVLRHAPAIKFLVTSRVRLGIEAEWLLDLEGLPYPPLNAAQTALSHAPPAYPSMQLFEQSSLRIKPDFDAVAARAAIERICQLLAGYPLAIELAANWVRSLSCDGIVQRLEGGLPTTSNTGLDLLTTTTSMVAARHQDMRTVLDYSWQLLNDDEKRVLRQLSIFQGGFTMHAAEAVTGAIVHLIAALVDKSWLRYEDTTGRYRIHELLRQFGAEQLALHPGEQSSIRQKYCNYYAQYLHDKSTPLVHGVTPADLHILDTEIENLRAAWATLLAEGQLDTIDAYLHGLWRYYQCKGWFSEALSVINQACAMGHASRLQQGRWHRWLSEAHYQMGHLEESRLCAEKALMLLAHPLPTTPLRWQMALLGQILRQVVHRLLPAQVARSVPQERAILVESARVMGGIGQVYYFTERPLHALIAALADLNFSERTGSAAELGRGYSITTLTLSNVPFPALAAYYARLAEGTLQQVDNLPTKAYALEILGVYNIGSGQWTKAEAVLEQCTDYLAQLGLHRWWEEARLLMALAAYHRGQFVHSAHRFTEALHSARHRGDPLAQCWALLGLVECALRLGGVYSDSVMIYLEEAKALPPKYLSRAEVVRLHGALARVYLQQGDFGQARREAETALHLMKQTIFWIFWTFEGYTGPAEVFLKLLEHSQAAKLGSAEVTSLRRLLQESCKAMQRFAKIYSPGRPRALLYQGLLAWHDGKAAKAHGNWQKSLSAAEDLQMPYEQARAHAEIARHLAPDEPARHLHTARATELFTQLETHAG